MRVRRHLRCFPFQLGYRNMKSISFLILCPLLLSVTFGAEPAGIVTETPGLVAFWDFVQREPDGLRRFTAHVPAGATTDYPLDAANYIKDYWGAGREATYTDFPQLGRGPFGNAIRIVKETDPDFRPFLFVPRARLHDTPLDIKGARNSHASWFRCGSIRGGIRTIFTHRRTLKAEGHSRLAALFTAAAALASPVGSAESRCLIER
jgi:hypothetical protein